MVLKLRALTINQNRHDNNLCVSISRGAMTNFKGAMAFCHWCHQLQHALQGWNRFSFHVCYSCILCMHKDKTWIQFLLTKWHKFIVTVSLGCAKARIFMDALVKVFNCYNYYIAKRTHNLEHCTFHPANYLKQKPVYFVPMDVNNIQEMIERKL